MKNTPEHISRIHDKVEEIRLSTQVELAIDYAKFKKNAAQIKAIIKEVTAFDFDLGTLEDIPEVYNAIKSLKDFEKKVASAK